MTDELKDLKTCIVSCIVSERNHIFKYTSPLVNPSSSEAKAVFYEYDRATSNARYHNYNVDSILYGDIQVDKVKVPNFHEFLANKLNFHFDKDRQSYAKDRILDYFRSYDEDGCFEEFLITDYAFEGEIDHEIFKSWLLFNHLFDISSQIAKRIEAKNFIGIQNHLKLIDDNFGFLMNGKKSFFQLKMDEDELYSWLLTEIKLFKHQVEDRELWKCLNGESEKHFQIIFGAVLGRVSELYDVDMSPEPSTGSGNVDFKFSQGNSSKVCVELKLSTSSKTLEGYTHQLQKYLSSEKTDKGIYVVIDSGNSKSSYNKLLKLIEDGKMNGKAYPDIILIDASSKPTASKLG
ncbi:hypothetical protein [Vibrio antiquarius]|uniref:hypothetical protein n=1 Tax=Vibrio antiquarius (strain Ex25) TaxID=150340 RepID=UPI002658340E|nr:hypothetical protein [Vibrio antiquarius]MCR9964037.1 hypothetical protein [Vibrio antiquarius]